ncbi:MAG: hypothetical protein IJN79_11895 [Clostridia bacterium]|nr:hypothetical protein [Clostridia bacterium]MBQ6857811.1 hypothetical protein [Clostridia bacterium]MBQ7053481.1 hypothetical protein [Clostridia bacterium]
MVNRFLKYSLEREKKICAVLMQDGQMIKRNLLVTAMDETGFSARFPGRKRDVRIALSDVMTCAYARGDQGELE